MITSAARFSVFADLSGKDLFASVALGLAGFAINRFPIDLGWGNHLMLGSALALLGLRLLPPLPAILAISLAASATVLAWDHPWAWLVWTIEAACLALTVRRASPILVDFLFWLLLGGPLLYAAYGGILGMSGAPLWLVIAKQSLNGLLNVWLAEALYLALLLCPPAVRRMRIPAMPTPAFVMMSVTAVALLPLPFYLWLDAHQQEQVILSTRASAAQREIAQFQDRVTAWFDNRSLALRVVAADTLHDRHVDVVAARLGPLVGDFDQISIRGADGRLIAAYPPGSATEPLPQDPLWRAEGASWSVTPVFDGTSTMASFIELAVSVPGTDVVMRARLRHGRMLEIFGGFRAASDSALVLVSARGTIITTLGAVQPAAAAIDRVGAGGRELLPRLKEPTVFATSGFGQSLMTHMQNATYVVAAPVLGPAEGPWIVVFKLLRPAIQEARAAQLRVLTIQWFFLALSVVGAAIVSYVAGVRLQALSGLVSRIVSTPLGRKGQREEPSIIKELGDIDQHVDQLGGLLQSERQEALSFQERLDTIQKHTPIVIYEVDIEDGFRIRARWTSESLERVLGYRSEDLGASRWWISRVHPADSERMAQRFSALQPGQIVAAEYRFRHKDGSYRWLYDVLLVGDAPEADGTLRGSGFVIDVTARKEAEQQVIQASKLASLGTMATGVAHELNQPLNVIKIGASNLRADLQEGFGSTEDHLQQIAGIIRQVDRAAKLISHMRLFGRQPLEPAAPFDLAAVRDGLLSLIAAQLSAERISFSVSLEANLPLVTGHAILLEQVLLNIVLNARDAILERRTSEHDHNGVIALAASRSSAGVAITIEDNGIGMSPDVLEHLFEPFFTTKSIGKGTGLGLAVSYGIVRDMGGTLEASSSAVGARFVLTLPAVAPADPS